MYILIPATKIWILYAIPFEIAERPPSHDADDADPVGPAAIKQW
jgi:hypothetical protein